MLGHDRPFTDPPFFWSSHWHDHPGDGLSRTVGRGSRGGRPVAGLGARGAAIRGPDRAVATIGRDRASLVAEMHWRGDHAALEGAVAPGCGRMTATRTAPGDPDSPVRHLRVVEPAPAEVDVAAAETAVRDLLAALGQDPSAEHLRDTPRRVASALAELLTARSFELTTFPNDEGYDELVVARDITFRSLCEHHLLPFTGRAHVGYLPGERILGLSKLARVVELFSCRLQVQERLTSQIARWLEDNLSPKGWGGAGSRAHVHVAAGRPCHGSSTVVDSAGRDPRRSPHPRRVLRPDRPPRP